MAKINIKLFGVLRIDAKIDKTTIEADSVAEVFPKISELAEGEMTVSFGEALIYLNGERCTSKRQKLNDGDEVWLLSPASGG
ncbi:MAG: MoaD/ThiS family protein [Eubacteriales bacterium]